MNKEINGKVSLEDRPYPSFDLSDVGVNAFIKKSPFYDDGSVNVKLTDSSGSNGNSKKAKKGIFGLGKEAKQKKRGPETLKVLNILKRVSAYK